jgi:hypothetical protein
MLQSSLYRGSSSRIASSEHGPTARIDRCDTIDASARPIHPCCTAPRPCPLDMDLVEICFLHKLEVVERRFPIPLHPCGLHCSQTESLAKELERLDDRLDLCFEWACACCSRQYEPYVRACTCHAGSWTWRKVVMSVTPLCSGSSLIGVAEGRKQNT